VRAAVGLATIASDLRWRISTGHVDRITALGIAGIASPIGAALLKAYVANDHHSYCDALGLMTKRVKCNFPYSWKEAVARQALREMLLPFCTSCLGATDESDGNAYLVVQDIKVLCPACQGSGKRLWTDTERATGIGVDVRAYRIKFEKLLVEAINSASSDLRDLHIRLSDWLDD